MTATIERRTSLRHIPVYQGTKVELMDRDGQRMTRARVVNISHEGALIIADRQPPLNQALRVRLALAPELGWITAIPVRFGQSREVGLRFTRRCPPDFIWVAARSGPARLAADGEEGTRFTFDRATLS